MFSARTMLILQASPATSVARRSSAGSLTAPAAQSATRTRSALVSTHGSVLTWLEDLCYSNNDPSDRSLRPFLPARLLLPECHSRQISDLLSLQASPSARAAEQPMGASAEPACRYAMATSWRLCARRWRLALGFAHTAMRRNTRTR